MILAGDIGGTHTRLALFETAGGLKSKAEKIYLSRKYASLEEIAREFLGSESVSRACFGIAGPIRNGRCQATNLPWVIDAATLSQHLKIPSVHLLNDLEANAYGLRALKPDELGVLHPGQPGQKGNAALIAAGTGLGEAGLYWDGKEHHPFACEGGHCDFAPRNREEFELFLYLQKKYSHVSYERVVSGPGIHEIYDFLIETGREKEALVIRAEMKEGDPTAVISENGRLGQDPACIRAIDWFISLYGAEAGNLALKILSIGGLYIGGGIAPHLLEKMKQGAFLSSFSDKGRFKNLLESIPIWVILNDKAALLGAAYFSSRLTQ
jgi:glucokinase